MSNAKTLADIKALAGALHTCATFAESGDTIKLDWLVPDDLRKGPRCKPGAGREVLSALIHYADQRGKHTELSVPRRGSKLIEYYKKHGFAVTSNDGQFDLIMTRPAQKK